MEEGNSKLRSLSAAVLAITVGVLAGCGHTSPQATDGGVGMSEAEYLEIVSQGAAEYYEVADPPLVEVVRFVDTDELDEVSRQCMDELGFGSDYLWFPGQDGDFKRAEYVCIMRYPTIQRYTGDWGQDQKRIQYQWTVEFVIPCLEAEGHAIQNVPSEAEFLDRYEADPFYPFSQVILTQTDPDVYNTEWARLESLCTQIAPGVVAWDGMSIAQWQDTRK